MAFLMPCISFHPLQWTSLGLLSFELHKISDSFIFINYWVTKQQKCVSCLSIHPSGSVFGFSINFALLDPDIFTQSSWGNCSSFIRLDSENRWTSNFRSSCSFLFRLRSRLWLGHSNAPRLLVMNHFSVILAAWWVLLSWRLVKLCHGVKSFALCRSGHLELDKMSLFLHCSGSSVRRYATEMHMYF